MRIIDELAKYISTFGKMAVTDVDSFIDVDDDRILISQTPSSAKDTRYFDGSRKGTFNFDIQVKNESAKEAVQKLFELEALLDLPEGLALENDITFISCEVTKTATKIAETDKGYKIYASGFSLKYYIGGND